MNAAICDLAAGAQHNFTRHEWDHHTGKSTTFCTRCGAQLKIAAPGDDSAFNIVVPAKMAEANDGA